MLVRIFGERLAMDGALAMGFTRGRHQRPFGAVEARIAEQALPAFHGAAERILGNGVASFAERKGLSRAEARVLAALALGLSNREIGRRLSVSIDTVKTHVSRIFGKLGVRTRTQVVLALKRGS
jgi:DNA-binding NarL/FixJ family response regulator